ncbi:DNA-binding protein [Pelomonas sp. SE-A7]|uniref:DNA-binding protein n=1 Tax=Pelomonas sp. SE-A7 TaxID=3054953 RepID=UPI003390454B
MTTLRTPVEARAWLQRHGVTISEWARANGFKPAVVAALLAGRSQGNWGEAHQAAVALGLRSPPAEGEEHPLASALRAPSRVPAPAHATRSAS